ncbi:OLC1v1007945C1 [Oldenlandia corymbosa var. corymbosa]|uniref:OLC1v1007945C1 n=1 Tax=Oldenlandia corymbosa var. corymbosa TaxID=529605 RepID=A0AAV1DNU2_OLDCO|nr:OLC1v1007945C1 [Oldenlandia corymbosa var. corymbosa]
MQKIAEVAGDPTPSTIARTVTQVVDVDSQPLLEYVVNHRPSSQSETAASNGGTSTSPVVEVRDAIDHRTVVDVSFANENRQSTLTLPSTSINSLAANVLGENPASPEENQRQQATDFWRGLETPSRPLTAQQTSVISAPVVQSILSHPDFQKSRVDKSQSNSLSGQYLPSNKEVISSTNSSNNSSSQKLNPAAQEFTISHQPQIPLLKDLLPITAPKMYLSKDDTEIRKTTETFIPNYSIEEINSEGRLNHASNGSDDNDIDMEYAMEEEPFYSEISTTTFHNHLKKVRAKKKVQVRRYAILNKD